MSEGPNIGAVEKRPMVSLCMIVRDEEKSLAQSLASLKPLADEIVVVDTGSKDRSVEIADSYGAKVFQFEWGDDFAAARNFSISKAKGKWILSLDADEAIAECDYPMFKTLLNDTGLCWRFTARHYTNDPRMSNFKLARGEYAEWERNYGGYFESGRVRLFLNDPEIRFSGPVHELAEYSILELGKYKIQQTGIPIHNYGHSFEPERAKDERKARLYAQLGEKKLEDNPSWENYFDLGLEYSSQKRYEQSLSNLEKAAEINPNFAEIYSRMGYVLCELGRYSDAIHSFERVLRINPRDHEAYGNLGVVFIRMEKYSLAVDALTHATRFFPEYVFGHYTLAKALLRMGKVREAVRAYDRTLQIYPSFTTAKVELGTILVFLKELDKAEELLLSALEEDCEHASALYNLGLLYQTQKRFSQAVTAFERFLQLSGNGKLKAQVERVCQKLKHLDT